MRAVRSFLFAGLAILLVLPLVAVAQVPVYVEPTTPQTPTVVVPATPQSPTVAVPATPQTPTVVVPATPESPTVAVPATPPQEPTVVVPANPYPSTVIQTPTGTVPVYRVTVVGRSVAAVNYRYRKGDTRISFMGTPLLPGADGRAKVSSNQGFTRIDADFRHLPPANTLGPIYTTYVLWAITPNGRAVNLGEVVPNSDGSTDLHVTSDLQAFGMIVTAEPYFSVTRPSDVVVMDNRVTDKTQGIIEQVNANYELLKRGSYESVVGNVPPNAPIRGDLLQVTEARNAERIAEGFQAPNYASDTFARAQELLRRAEGYESHDRKSAAMLARQATQTFEDARLIAVDRQEQAERARQRAEQQAAQESARQRAEQEAQLRAQAEEQQREAEQLRRQETQRAAAAEAARQQALAAQQQALAEQQRAQAAALQSQREAQQAEQLRQQAEQQNAQAREELRQQLSQIMQTRETARGLIMTMPDVLFDTGKATLKPMARERLAKVAGIMVSHPTLKLEVEGFTDSTGTAEFNQVLSEKRAGSVRDYLVAQGVRSENITARGFGEEAPVASNTTASGRQLNRRVEIVVSGAGIGQPQPEGLSSQR